jgi:hypothetical protein
VCLETLDEFRFEKDEIWAGIGIQAIEPIKLRDQCLSQVQAWIETETKNREGAPDAK